MEKICHSYCSNKMQGLIDDRKERAKAVWGTDWSLDKVNAIPNNPSSNMFNSIVYQGHEHKNIFDFDLLKWLLNHAGFNLVKRISEADLLAKFSEIPQRLDDAQTLYVVASNEFVINTDKDGRRECDTQTDPAGGRSGCDSHACRR